MAELEIDYFFVFSRINPSIFIYYMLYLERLYHYCSDSKKVLWLSTILGCLLMLIYAAFCFDMYDDVAKCYAPMVRDIGNGQFHQAFTGYYMIAPLLQTLAGVLCYLGIEAYTATIIISGLFYILTIFPLYGLLKRFTADHYAAWGCFAYIVAPKIIRFSGTGILNSGRNFFVVWTTYLLLSFFDDYKIKKLIWLGVSLAGLALIRGEGIGFIPLFGIMFICLFLSKSKNNRAIKQLLRLVAYGAIVGSVLLLVVAPRLIQMYQDYGYPVIDKRQSRYLYFLMGNPIEENKRVKVKLASATVNNNQLKTDEILQNLNTELKVTDKTTPAKPSRLQYFRRFLGNFSRGSYELYLIFAFWGVILIIKRRQWRNEYYILLAVVSFNALIFYDISIAYRSFSLNLPLFMPFTLVGGIALIKIIKQKLPAKIQPNMILIIIACMVTVGQIYNGMSKVIKPKKKYYFKQTGDWLKAHSSHNGQLTILAMQPQYAFWAAAKLPELDLGEKTAVDKINNYQFDYIVLSYKCQWLIEVLTARGYKKVSHPYDSKVTIFRPRPSQNSKL